MAILRKLTHKILLVVSFSIIERYIKLFYLLQ